ncbi:E3 ubiquitin-protein ligase UHRF1-like [Schistocerca americana]|uniref:E3 ubiquitin-protein ligase UHRF1-like n=1 Tax=Schistocerca americana TaxID=7009 RepID=UPI001F4FCFC2|nr:E3 ubiquitin-protein ligase UHRF1-like [Schistocerca americana]
MFVKVRGPDCQRIEIITITLLMPVKELKEKVGKLFDVEPAKQRLIYRGKQLEDEYKLFDYGVQMNEVLQLIVKQNVTQKEEVKEIQEPPLSTEKRLKNLPKVSETKHFKVGEYVDFVDTLIGAWFQGKIKNIYVENQARFDAFRNGIDPPTHKNGIFKDKSTADKGSGTFKKDSKEETSDEEIYETDSGRCSSLGMEENGTKGNEAAGNTCESKGTVQGELQDSAPDASPEKTNAASDTEHSESGDSGHSSHTSVKKPSQRNGDAMSKGAPGDETKLDDGCVYEITNLNHVDEAEMLSKLSEIRPMSQKLLKFADVKVGQTVLVNYNDSEPDKLGHWFDLKVSKVANGRMKKWLEGELRIHSRSGCQLNNVKISNVEKIWVIEKLELLKDRKDFSDLESIQKRPVPALCDKCNDNPLKRCKSCSCQVCGKKNEPSKQIMCDECDSPYHIWCLTPPLEEIPDVDEWFCPDCKNDENEIVRAGHKLKASKKKENSVWVKSGYTKWGKGMANVGLSKRCTIVPPHHFGPIPGVEVGTCWKFRIQASEAGVHRPPVSGIHGREDVGAFSIVLSGGYEDDEDFGDSFWYTGAGGRDLSGNKRTSVQSSDQLLTNTNKALAVNCAAPLNEKGAKADDWKKGKPVRVIRSYKFRKHSKFAPEEGLRYDGIYKVAEYRPEKGQSGFIVWRYFLRRDDPTPAPWTAAGKKLIASLGLQLEVPENYDVALAKKSGDKPKKTAKRKLSNGNEINFFTKKVKAEPYVIDAKIQKIIAKDKQNTKLWETCSSSLQDGKKKYLDAVMENFSCICCQELLYRPITTPCNHNFCLDCMQRAFKAEVYTCPTCREDLTKKFQFVVNEHLFGVLKAFFPGYEEGRK